MPIDDAATRNVTDLRRARQRARSVIGDIFTDVIEFLESEGIQIWEQETATPRQRQKRINQAITQLASQRLQRDLVNWLEERHLTTMARAARAAFNRMQGVLPGVDESDLLGKPRITHQDRALNAELRNIDAALLYEDGDSIAHEIGDRCSRQIRIGFSQNEPISSDKPGVQDISDRVEYVLRNGDADGREETGVSGMTVESKSELIAHDSVQDAYVTSAHRRYLQNGFRYAKYDAVIDNKTSQVCRRLNEVIVDLVDDPWLVPPNHPWCRSGLRPLLQLPEGEEPIDQNDIGDDHLNRIWGTNGFRPKVLDTSKEFNPTVLNEHLERTGVPS